MTLSHDMRWKSHVNKVCKKASQRLGMLNHFKFTMPRSCLIHLYKSLVLPIIDYGDTLYDNCNAADKHTLEMVHHRAARLVTGCSPFTNVSTLLTNELGWESLQKP